MCRRIEEEVVPPNAIDISQGSLEKGREVTNSYATNP